MKTKMNIEWSVDVDADDNTIRNGPLKIFVDGQQLAFLESFSLKADMSTVLPEVKAKVVTPPKGSTAAVLDSCQRTRELLSQFQVIELI